MDDELAFRALLSRVLDQPVRRGVKVPGDGALSAEPQRAFKAAWLATFHLGGAGLAVFCVLAAAD
jgi:hypothetical protein